MRSPKDMTIIQIEITNACVFTCSNCTRMCGHHAKPFMMDFDTFKKAVDSLDGYGGTISIMGGEPTLHPEFEAFVGYLRSKYPHLYTKGKDSNLLHPMTDFMKTVQDVALTTTAEYGSNVKESAMLPAPGLYSMLGTTYLKHFELIQDTFKRQVLNDHSNEMYHQPALISRKELGISDEQWEPLRDACWIQNTWSASITPKGAFFCEIAAALDVLFQGPGGWPIESDWWKREPEDFKEQLHWCELCGFACETFTRNANEKIDDVSPSLYEKLQTVNSPKVKANQVNVVDIKEGVISEESKATGVAYSSSGVSTGAPYIKYLAEKFNDASSLLHPEHLILVYDFTQGISEETMAMRVASLKHADTPSFVLCKEASMKKTWDSLAEGGNVTSYSVEDASYGRLLDEILSQTQLSDYVVVLSGELELTTEFIEKFKKSTANPGSLLYAENLSSSSNLSHWVTVTENYSGFIGILNKNAISLRDLGEEGRSAVTSLSQLKDLWQARKVISFAPHLFVGSSKDAIAQGERCAIFGGGGRSSDIYYLILKQGGSCVAVVDSDPAKQGNPFEEQLVIQAPDHLGSIKQDIDRVLIGSPIFYHEMKSKLLALGFDETIITSI